MSEINTHARSSHSPSEQEAADTTSGGLSVRSIYHLPSLSLSIKRDSRSRSLSVRSFYLSAQSGVRSQVAAEPPTHLRWYFCPLFWSLCPPQTQTHKFQFIGVHSIERMGMKLFDNGGSDSDDLSKIEINKEFARRYEHNKKREDIQRYDEMKKKGVIDSDIDSEEEDESSEDEENIVNYSRKQDLQFFDALIKVKKQDSSLKNKDAKLFDLDNEDETEDNNKEKKRKPMYLKDVTAKHLIEKGPEFDDEDDEEENKGKKKSYSEEQEVLRKEFLDAVGDEDNEDDLLKVKNDKGGIEDEDEDEVEYEKKLDEYFEEDEKLDENEKFLKDYFRKKMWLDKETGSSNHLNDVELDVSEDEEELERQENFEREFNFRFEENAGDRVMGFSRKVDGSVRKKDNARKIQRKNKEERIALAELERKEELKHMKNLKKKEMNEKIRKIRETAGIGENEVCLLDEHDLEEEFDPDEHDRTMKKAFDDSFYEADDVDPRFGSEEEEEDGELEKPNFDEEDEFLGLPKRWENEYGSGDGFLATREKTLKGKIDNSHDEEDKKKKRKRSEVEEEAIKKELEEYYKLDYEDTIGDLKTREDEFIVPRHKIKEHKQRIKSLLKGETSENGGKRIKHDVDKSNEQVVDDAQNEGEKVLSRKQRRKKKLNEFKLPPSRLLAYQKITGAKSSNKRKHKA
ncbi:unnamed protein product [Lactuca virosa]|uniref:Kri1-like C-terminal domain-containing protein n=1 Tax=Lactuca virosa TaxID=75947 RepID=A0AAU9LR06_9ASTR|nr:unnamed protein product [Lactuca virosa]